METSPNNPFQTRFSCLLAGLVLLIVLPIGLEIGLIWHISGLLGPAQWESLLLSAILWGFGLFGVQIWIALVLASGVHEQRQSCQATQKALRESEARLRGLARNFPNGAIVKFDKDLCFLLADGLGLADMGLSRDQMEGRRPAEIFPPETSRIIESFCRETLAGAEKVADIFLCDRYFQVRTVPIRDPDGRISRGVIMTQDITESRMNAQTLSHLNNLFLGILEYSNVAIAVMDVTGRFLLVNPASAAMIGKAPEQIEQCPMRELFAPELADFFMGEIQKVSRTGLPLTKEENIRLQGRSRVYLTTLFPLFDAKNTIYAICGLSTDMSALKETEASLREKQEIYHGIFKAVNDALFLVNAETEAILDANPAASRLYGYRTEEFLKMRATDLSAEPWRCAAVLAEGRTGIPLREHIRKDGSRFDVEIRLSYYQKSGQRMAVVNCRDITEQRQWEQSIRAALKEKEVLLQKIRQSQENYQLVADFTYDWETWRGPDGGYRYVSPSCERISGYPQSAFLADPWLKEQIAHPDDQKKLSDHLRNHHQLEAGASISFRIIRKDGQERWVCHLCQPVYDDQGNWLGRRASNRDVTDKKKLTDAMHQANKLESVGLLAGGMAHDFNNLLMTIVGNICLAQDDIPPEARSQPFLADALAAAQAASDLTQKLITFSRGGSPVKKQYPVDKLLNQALEGAGLTEDDCHIHVAIDLPAKIPDIHVDPRQMRHAIANILINAREAMPEGGRIRLSAEIISRTEADAAPGQHLRIGISDQGPGIAPADLARIFDPYFSTKQRGKQKGMGLGLSVSHAVVEKHEGRITARSEPGKGSVFFIDLPLAG